MANYYHSSRRDTELTKKAIKRSNEKYFRRHSIRTMSILSIGIGVAISLAGIKNSDQPQTVTITENQPMQVSAIMPEAEQN